MTLSQTSYIVVPMMFASIDIHLVYSLVILMLTLTASCVEDIAAIPMNTATKSSGKVDHHGSYANKVGVAVGVVDNY